MKTRTLAELTAYREGALDALKLAYENLEWFQTEHAGHVCQKDVFERYIERQEERTDLGLDDLEAKNKGTNKPQ